MGNKKDSLVFAGLAAGVFAAIAMIVAFGISGQPAQGQHGSETPQSDMDIWMHDAQGNIVFDKETSKPLPSAESQRNRDVARARWARNKQEHLNNIASGNVVQGQWATGAQQQQINADAERGDRETNAKVIATREGLRQKMLDLGERMPIYKETQSWQDMVDRLETKPGDGETNWPVLPPIQPLTETEESQPGQPPNQ